MLYAALPTELEYDLLSVDLCVTIPHRGQAKRFVRPGIFVIAYPDQRLGHDLHDRRQHLLARQTLQPEVSGRRLTDLRQSLGEVDHMIVLVCVAHFAPPIVITILLASTIVPPQCLDV